MTKQLNKEQLAVLEKYERFFNQAVGARYCSYPGQAGVTEMLSIWNEVTKENRTIRQGCSTCIFHLVVDLGTLYLAQKAEMQKEANQAEGKTTEEKPAQEGAAPSDGTTAQSKSEKPATGKGKGKGKK